MSTELNSVGLLLDIAGALLLLRYGLPPRIDPEGKVHLITGGIDEGEVALGKRYRKWSNIGVILLIAGFAFQLISNFVI